MKIVMGVLVRSHLLCPYFDCFAHNRRDIQRIQVLVDESRNVELRKPIPIEGTRLSYLYKRWVKLSKCPYCNKSIEVVIDETHTGRNIYLRIPRALNKDYKHKSDEHVRLFMHM